MSQAALWLYLFSDENKQRNLLAAGVAAGLAVATKDAAAALVLGSGLIVTMFGASRIKHSIYFATAISLTYFIIAILPQPLRWVEHLRLNDPDAAYVARFIEFDHSFSGQFGLLKRTITELVSIVSPAGLALAVAGVIALLIFRQRRELIFLMLPLFFIT